MLILRAKIALNAVICMILFIFSLIMESWILRNVGFYRSLLQFYVLCKYRVFKYSLRVLSFYVRYEWPTERFKLKMKERLVNDQGLVLLACC